MLYDDPSPELRGFTMTPQTIMVYVWCKVLFTDETHLKDVHKHRMVGDEFKMT